MRKARTPHEGCGLSSGGAWRRAAAGFACALSCAFLIASMTLLTTGAALAQTSGATGDPFAPANKKKPSSFPKGSMFGKVNTNVDRSQPMRLQGDQLIYDKAGNRVIARGNVEIYYNNYILTADEVVYDQGAGTPLLVEPGIRAATRAQLARGERKIVDAPEMGAAAAVGLDASGTFVAAGDPRKDGGSFVAP